VVVERSGVVILVDFNWVNHFLYLFMGDEWRASRD
jgi:hypothetical protein